MTPSCFCPFKLICVKMLTQRFLAHGNSGATGSVRYVYTHFHVHIHVYLSRSHLELHLDLHLYSHIHWNSESHSIYWIHFNCVHVCPIYIPFAIFIYYNYNHIRIYVRVLINIYLHFQMYNLPFVVDIVDLYSHV